MVLLDVVLPDISGIEACRQIKEDQDLKDIFVILTSGIRTSSEHQAEGLNMGADGFIVKPVSNKELLARVQSMVRIKKAEEALQASETRYRRLFETAQDGILILNAETGQIDDVNPFLIDMLGYTYEEFVGKKLWEIGAFKNTEKSKAALAELQHKGYVRYEDLPLATKDGREIDVEFVSNTYPVITIRSSSAISVTSPTENGPRKNSGGARSFSIQSRKCLRLGYFAPTKKGIMSM